MEKIINIQLDISDAERLDQIKKDMNAKTRPETIRNLMQSYEVKK